MSIGKRWTGISMYVCVGVSGNVMVAASEVQWKPHSEDGGKLWEVDKKSVFMCCVCIYVYVSISVIWKEISSP